MKINVDIERLVLDGVPLDPAAARLLKEALGTELARLLAGGGVNAELAAGGALRDVRTAEMQVSGESPAQLGERIAGSVYRGIGK